MEILLIFLIVFVLLTVGLLSYRNYYAPWKAQGHLRQKLEVFRPLLEKLNAKQIIDVAEVLALAKDPSLRHGVFRMLEDFGRDELFPVEYLTREKGAESHMVMWLEYPTELGRAPDDIALISTVLHKAEAGLEYFVFRFSSLRPQWAARTGWMIGVSGPYPNLAHPYDAPLRVFSRFKRMGTVSVEQEVEWVHENINPGEV